MRTTNPLGTLRALALCAVLALRIGPAHAEKTELEATAEARTEVEEPAAGSIFRDCAECPEMVVIPAGRFEMGSNDGGSDEKPVHSVDVRSFALGKYEVTQGQWRAVMGSNPSYFMECGDDCPVEQVSWEEAKSYIRKLNERVSGKGDGPYRLPSEAEWEYACRGGERHRYCGGSDVDRVAWYDGNSGRKPHRVGTKDGNRFGLHDQSGNVWEWVEDCWHDTYGGAPPNGGPWTGGGNCSWRVFRGASWYSKPAVVRSAFRFWDGASERSYDVGFRVARTLP